MGTHDFRHLGDSPSPEQRLRALEADVDAIFFCNDTVEIVRILSGLIKAVQQMEERQRENKTHDGIRSLRTKKKFIKNWGKL